MVKNHFFFVKKLRKNSRFFSGLNLPTQSFKKTSKNIKNRLHRDCVIPLNTLNSSHYRERVIPSETREREREKERKRERERERERVVFCCVGLFAAE